MSIQKVKFEDLNDHTLSAIGPTLTIDSIIGYVVTVTPSFSYDYVDGWAYSKDGNNYGIVEVNNLNSPGSEDIAFTSTGNKTLYYRDYKVVDGAIKLGTVVQTLPITITASTPTITSTPTPTITPMVSTASGLLMDIDKKYVLKITQVDGGGWSDSFNGIGNNSHNIEEWSPEPKFVTGSTSLNYPEMGVKARMVFDISDNQGGTQEWVFASTIVPQSEQNNSTLVSFADCSYSIWCSIYFNRLTGNYSDTSGQNLDSNPYANFGSWREDATPTYSTLYRLKDISLQISDYGDGRDFTKSFSCDLYESDDDGATVGSILATLDFDHNNPNWTDYPDPSNPPPLVGSGGSGWNSLSPTSITVLGNTFSTPTVTLTPPPPPPPGSFIAVAFNAYYDGTELDMQTWLTDRQIGSETYGS